MTPRGGACAAGAASLLLLGACQNVKAPASPTVASNQAANAPATPVMVRVQVVKSPQPPDSVPSWIYADTNLVDGSHVIAGKVAKNVVIVAFDSAMTSAAREAVLSRVHGTTVGGVRMKPEVGGGFYYVRVEAPTPAAVLAITGALASVPGVALAVAAMNDALGPDMLRQGSRSDTIGRPPASAP